jgi:hypothetical protein
MVSYLRLHGQTHYVVKRLLYKSDYVKLPIRPEITKGKKRPITGQRGAVDSKVISFVEISKRERGYGPVLVFKSGFPACRSTFYYLKITTY